MNEEFMTNLKLLLMNFEPVNKCDRDCSKCQLDKVIIEVDCEWYVQYTLCDLLEKVRDNI